MGSVWCLSLFIINDNTLIENCDILYHPTTCITKRHEYDDGRFVFVNYLRSSLIFNRVEVILIICVGIDMHCSQTVEDTVNYTR